VTGIALAGATFDGFETVNVGTDTHHTILDLIEEIFECVHWRPNSIRRELDKPVGVKSRAADISKCRERLGWIPSHTLREGVGRTVKWYLDGHTGERRSRLDERLLMERN
jgi:nucleoside-diphosphate-sugar epimerase